MTATLTDQRPVQDTDAVTMGVVDLRDMFALVMHQGAEIEQLKQVIAQLVAERLQAQAEAAQAQRQQAAQPQGGQYL